MVSVTGARDDPKFEEFTAEGRAKKRGKRRAAANGGAAEPIHRHTPRVTETFREDLDGPIERLGRAACANRLRRSLERCADLSVVRVVIPGLEAPDDDDTLFRDRGRWRPHGAARDRGDLSGPSIHGLDIPSA